MCEVRRYTMRAGPPGGSGSPVCVASVAQLAERNHGKVEVSGSIPLGSFRLWM